MISDPEINNNCKPCKRKQLTAGTKKNAGLFTGILLALLPKCPFCFVAFSSTMMLCGEGGTLASQRTFTSSATILFTVLFCLVALICIILNYRDARTKYAVALAVLGTTFIVLSVTVIGGLPLYYSGVAFVFIAVWLNASLLYLLHKVKNSFSKRASGGFKTIHQV